MEIDKNHITLDTFLQKHAWKFLIISMLCVISFLYGLPHLLWLNEMDWEYKDTIFITSFQAVDAYYYTGQLREIYDGNYFFSNSYLFEHRNTTMPICPLFPLYTAVFLGKLLDIHVQYLLILMDFTLPPLIFLLSYSLLYTIISRRYTSILGAFLLTVIPHIFKTDGLLSTLFHLLEKGFTLPIFNNAHCYHCFSRPINPQLTYNFLLAALVFFFKGIKTGKIRFFIFSFLCGIMTSYSYVYFSTYLYVFWGVWIIFAVILQAEYFHLKETTVVFSLTVICSLPFWFLVFSFQDKELSQMAVMIKDHSPILNRQIFFTLAICFVISVCLVKKYITPLKGIPALALLLSGVICFEQHVITGIHVLPWHYDVFVIPQSILLAVFIVIGDIQRRIALRWKKNYVPSFFIYNGIILTVVGILSRPAFITRYFSPDGILTDAFQKFLEALHWLGIIWGLIFLVSGLFLKKHFCLSNITVNSLSLYFKRFQNLSQTFLTWGRLLIYSLCILYIICDIGITQYQRYQSFTKPKFSYLQQLLPAIVWINEHLERESVFLGSTNYSGTNAIITTYTSHYVYVEQYAQYYTVPLMEEIMDRLYNLMYFSGVISKENFQHFVEKETRNRPFGGAFQPDFQQYQKKIGKDIYTELKKYHVDYLFYGPDERKSFNLAPETYPFLQKVYSDEHVAIYRIL
ncbi:MAG: hypothetical protein JXB49_28500 [Bacteroidales bacterium]|nr:hypothetical protein [Bacteroidales bacterium]